MVVVVVGGGPLSLLPPLPLLSFLVFPCLSSLPPRPSPALPWAPPPVSFIQAEGGLAGWLSQTNKTVAPPFSFKQGG